ncbi:MAG TPA: response regulator [Caldilineae bacterium]|nr:response regulator [Caldilineae bacterium]
MTYDEFVDNVRDALTHLYDPVHLQSHPLARYLDGVADADKVTRAQKLRRLLIEAIEQLSPVDATSASPDASCGYSALCYRYIDGLTPEEIAGILAISPRQVYRKLREGVEAVATVLWDQLQMDERARPAQSSTPTDRRTLAQATVEQLSARAHPEILDIHDVLRGILNDLKPYCDQIGAGITLSGSSEPLPVYADRTMLRQALMNLLTSGLDQTGRQPLLIHIERRPGQLQLTLSPQPETRPRVLFSGEVKREGIGWEVALQLLRKQGGQVAYQEDPWRVEVRMPLAGPHHVLVIDDMSDIIDLFQRFTSQYAIEVIGAGTAAEAFEVLQQVTPSLILLDVMLPRQDGWEILQRLKANPATSQIPVVICSILNEPGLATALGADGYLRKPVSQEALRQELSRWLPLTPAPDVTSS